MTTKTLKTLQTRSIALLLSLAFTLSLHTQDTIPTVKIGNQVWMVKNLDVVTFRNGDTIPEAQTFEEWRKASEEGKPAWCYQANLPEYGQKYGKLYNWYAVNDPRGLAPKGFHVPTQAEWDSLVSYLGGEEIAGKKLKSTEGWREEGNGTNETGFSGLPGGCRFGSGDFHGVGGDAYFWSATEDATSFAWSFFLYFNFDSVRRSYDSRGVGLSVRCLRD